MTQLYAIALGSNRCHGRYGGPRGVLDAAMGTLAELGVVAARSPILTTRAMGPAGRAFANAAMLLETRLAPDVLLKRLKAIERGFGRRRGRRWGARVLDLDILLWSGGHWETRGLTVPHAGLAERAFVLTPLVAIAPRWRVPGAYTVRQLHARLTRAKPLHRAGGTVGP